MLMDIAGLVITAAPLVGLLAWRHHVDHREREAGLVRADIHASATRVLGGESLLAIAVECPTAWRPGHVRLSAPTGYESLVEEVSHAVLGRVPDGYEVVIHCGGGS